ncbi:MAG: hypothetical protein WEC75_09355 [Dehalococcoidia bacterium]
MATSYEFEDRGRRVDEVVWTPEELDIVERPNGPAFAAVLAAGAGALVLGIVTSWAEASESLRENLQFQDRVGPLSGKTTVAGIAFVVAWAVLAPVLWRRNLPWLPVLVLAGALIAGGLVGTFPKFFELFAPD